MFLQNIASPAGPANISYCQSTPCIASLEPRTCNFRADCSLLEAPGSKTLKEAAHIVIFMDDPLHNLTELHTT